MEERVRLRRDRRADGALAALLAAPVEPSADVEAGVLVARSIYIVVSGFRKERIRLRAASLTYVSLLSLVPAVAVVFSIFAILVGR